MIEIDYSKFSPADIERLKSVEFAIEVRAFCDSIVGRFLLAKAEAERTEALEQLAEVDAADRERVRELQLVVRRADSFQQWLADAVIEGENAEQELTGGQE